MSHTNATRRQQRGLSLVESLIALTVSSVAVGAALPGFDRAAERRRLEGATAQLVTDIKLARTEAVAHNRPMRISFASGNGNLGSCYVIFAGHAGDCRCTAQSAPVCSNGAQPLRSEAFAAGGPVQLRSNVASIVFDPVAGTSSPTGTMRLTSTQGHEVRVVVSLMGRTRKCSPAGVASVAGYPRC